MAAEGDRVKCEMRLEFGSAEDAEKVLGAVDTDNEGYVEARVDGSAIVLTVRADSLKIMLHTLDDLMACVSVADRIVSG